jgi:hypothetical protein
MLTSVCPQSVDCYTSHPEMSHCFGLQQHRDVVVGTTDSVAPEPEGSSPYSQEPATGTCPEPTGSNLHSPSRSPF